MVLFNIHKLKNKLLDTCPPIWSKSPPSISYQNSYAHDFARLKPVFLQILKNPHRVSRISGLSWLTLWESDSLLLQKTFQNPSYNFTKTKNQDIRCLSFRENLVVLILFFCIHLLTAMSCCNFGAKSPIAAVTAAR